LGQAGALSSTLILDGSTLLPQRDALLLRVKGFTGTDMTKASGQGAGVDYMCLMPDHQEQQLSW